VDFCFLLYFMSFGWQQPMKTASNLKKITPDSRGLILCFEGTQPSSSKFLLKW